MDAMWEMLRYFGWPYFLLIVGLLVIIFILVYTWDKI